MEVKVYKDVENDKDIIALNYKDANESFHLTFFNKDINVYIYIPMKDTKQFLNKEALKQVDTSDDPNKKLSYLLNVIANMQRGDNGLFKILDYSTVVLIKDVEAAYNVLIKAYKCISEDMKKANGKRKDYLLSSLEPHLVNFN